MKVNFTRPFFAILVLLQVGASKCESKPKVPAAKTDASADSSEQQIFGMRVAMTANGATRGMLRAAAARVYDNYDRFDLQTLTVSFTSATGADESTLTAREGRYDATRSRLEARGSVVIATKDGRRLQTENVVVAVERRTVTSDVAYVLDGPGGQHSKGTSFHADLDLKNFNVAVKAGTTPVEKTRNPGGK